MVNYLNTYIHIYIYNVYYDSKVHWTGCDDDNVSLELSKWMMKFFGIENAELQNKVNIYRTATLKYTFT